MPRRAGACAALLGMGLVACGGSAGARGADRPLPSWSGHAVDLFDDGIEPMAVGYPMDSTAAPEGDTRVRERTQTGDAVVRATVMTVTSKVEDAGRSWQIGLQTLQRLGGSGPLDKDFTLSIGPHDPAAGIVHAFEGRMIGKSVIVFVREFAREGAPPGEGELRFHIASDSADEQKAVNAAILAQQVR